ncbi:MAG TPA: YfiR family protein, partial [Candidatus Paceibacterota bacterium]|nr:YfiR family protein [Candidatus Paceibacterota bacterium]
LVGTRDASAVQSANLGLKNSRAEHHGTGRFQPVGMFRSQVSVAWLLFLALAIFGLGSTFHAHAQASREYQLKAVFLFNFAQFTEWPTNAFASTNSPLVIGVLGIDPFGASLDETVRGETVNGRRLVVQRYRRLEEMESCQILFICPSESHHADRILESLKGRTILTVGDMESPAGRDLAIRFAQENNKLRIRVNLQAVGASNLTLSSKLLRAAEVIPSK